MASRAAVFRIGIANGSRGATTQRIARLRGGGIFRLVADYRHWLQDDQKLAPAVRRCAEKLNKLLDMGYLRQSRYLKAKALARETLHQFRNVPAASCLDRAIHADFLLVQEIAHWTDREVENFRAQYANRLKARFSAYFDRVESNPLIESQRDACVIDEDNNLVLAGAGTGKTSTMVARGGFLIKSGQATPDQILMLAFANKAAREMQERLGRARGRKRHCCQYVPQIGHGHHRVSRKRAALDLAFGARRRVAEQARRAVVQGDVGEAEVQTIGSRLFRLLPVPSGQSL